MSAVLLDSSRCIQVVNDVQISVSRPTSGSATEKAITNFEQNNQSSTLSNFLTIALTYPAHHQLKHINRTWLTANIRR
jgi:hypothetical protein